MHKVMRLPKVIETTGLTKTTIYKRIADKTFPAQISLGHKAVGWLEADIQDWIQERIAQSQMMVK